MTGAKHVTVAVSRNPENATPIAGSYEGSLAIFKGITVDVTRGACRQAGPRASRGNPSSSFPASASPLTESDPNQPVQQALQMAQQAAIPCRGDGHGDPTTRAVVTTPSLPPHEPQSYDQYANPCH